MERVLLSQHVYTSILNTQQLGGLVKSAVCSGRMNTGMIIGSEELLLCCILVPNKFG